MHYYHTMQCTALKYNAMQQNTLYYHKIQYNILLYNSIRYTATFLKYSTINILRFHAVLQYDTVLHYIAMQYNTTTLAYLTIQYNNIQRHTMQFNTTTLAYLTIPRQTSWWMPPGKETRSGSLTTPSTPTATPRLNPFA